MNVLSDFGLRYKTRKTCTKMYSMYLLNINDPKMHFVDN